MTEQNILATALNKDPRDIILGPVVSEKSYSLIDEGKYTFLVDPRASKTEIKLAIEKMHGVDLDGRAITVNEARPKEENGGGGRSFSSPNRRAGAFQARGNSRY